MVTKEEGGGGGMDGEFGISRCKLAYILIECINNAQSCLTLCNPMDHSPSGSSVHGILQAKYWSGLPCPPPGDLPEAYIYIYIYICN